MYIEGFTRLNLHAKFRAAQARKSTGKQATRRRGEQTPSRAVKTSHTSTDYDVMKDLFACPSSGLRIKRSNVAEYQRPQRSTLQVYLSPVVVEREGLGGRQSRLLQEQLLLFVQLVVLWDNQPTNTANTTTAADTNGCANLERPA